MSVDRRLRELGVDPDGTPGEIMQAVDRIYAELRAKYDADGNPIPEQPIDKPIIVDAKPEP